MHFLFSFLKAKRNSTTFKENIDLKAFITDGFLENGDHLRFFKSMFSLKVVEFLFAFRKENKKIHFLFAFRKETEKCITVYTCRLSFAYCCKTIIKDESARVFRTLLRLHLSSHSCD